MGFSHKNEAFFIDKFHLKSGLDTIVPVSSQTYSHIPYNISRLALLVEFRAGAEAGNEGWKLNPWDFQGYVLNLEDLFTIPVSAETDTGIATGAKKRVLFLCVICQSQRSGLFMW